MFIKGVLFVYSDVPSSPNGRSFKNMGLLISCYEVCFQPRIANGESINPRTKVRQHDTCTLVPQCYMILLLQNYRRQSEQDSLLREKIAQDEMCGHLAPPATPKCLQKASSSSKLIKPQTGIRFYSTPTYEFMK